MAFEVWEESRKEKRTAAGVEVTRKFRVIPYSAVETVCDKLLGYVTLVGDGIVRVPPHKDPYTNSWCVQADVDPVEALNSPGNSVVNLAALDARNYSESAWITATYKPIDVDQPAGSSSTNSSQQEIDLASESYDYGGRMERVPNQFWAWDEGTDTVLLAKERYEATRNIPDVKLQLVRHLCVTRPHQAISRLCGRVNKSIFRVVKTEFAAETLRFDGLHAQRRISARVSSIERLPLWELTYKFEYIPVYDYTESGAQEYVGWNRKFRSTIENGVGNRSGQWQRPVLFNDKGKPLDAKRGLFDFDEDVTQTLRGKTVKGFALLFHPSAT
jgi:hypothetical protein